jgi:hypothetical protein
MQTATAAVSSYYQKLILRREGGGRGESGESYQRWASSCTNGSDEGRAGQGRTGSNNEAGEAMARDEERWPESVHCAGSWECEN